MKQLIFIFLSTMLVGCQQKAVVKQAKLEELADSIAKEKVPVEHLLFRNDTLSVYKIDSIDFFDAKASSIQKTDSLPYIEDFKQAKKRLRGRVVFGAGNLESGKLEMDTLTDGESLYSFRSTRGDTASVFGNMEFAFIGFYRYYPTEDILLFEGGHSSDFSIDLRTGLMGAEKVGNPAYIVYSPDKQLRLNGYFPGQECSSYFIQRKVDKDYKFYMEVPLHLTKEGFDLCNLKDVFWKNNNELYFRNTFFSDSKDARIGFFKLNINLR